MLEYQAIRKVELWTVIKSIPIRIAWLFSGGKNNNFFKFEFFKTDLLFVVIVVFCILSSGAVYKADGSRSGVGDSDSASQILLSDIARHHDMT